MKSQQLGIIILVLSVLSIGLLLYAKVQIDRHLLESCAATCGGNGDSCTMNFCPYRQSNNVSWIPVFASILVSALGGIGLYLALLPPEKFVEQKEYNLSTLTNEEKNLFYRIQQDKQGLYQSKLAEELGVSKVHMTRLLDRLEGLGLVERKRRGLTNIVVVT